MARLFPFVPVGPVWVIVAWFRLFWPGVGLSNTLYNLSICEIDVICLQPSIHQHGLQDSLQKQSDFIGGAKYLCSGTRVPPFFTSCMRRGFLLMRASFVMLSTTRSDARARKGVSFYLSACRFPVFLYTNCTSVYLVWQIHFFSDLEMYYACGFVIKTMIICSSQNFGFRTFAGITLSD